MIVFVGAGSGAVDLITLRGKNYLEEADTIIYAGSLVNPDLLRFAKEECKIYDSARMTLEEVMEVMRSSQGLLVRLHTGDPSLYGAIREQMRLLDEENLLYEVVPGVSSFSAAAASLKREYTLPGVSQSLIITRIEGKTPVPPLESLEKMAEHQCSMAIFLSSGHLQRVQEALLKGGYPEDTPVAMVYKASWPDEDSFVCKLSELAEQGEGHGFHRMALILVGRFLEGEFERSLLYHPEFETEFRKVKK